MPEFIEDKKDERDLLEMALMNQGSSLASERIVSKELFNKENINQKTRLDANEISLVNRGFFISQFFAFKGYKEMAGMIKKYYEGIIEFRPSLEGLSRTEFVDVFKQELEQVVQEKQGFKIK